MPAQYGQEAIDLCRSLYCKYGGKNFAAIERDMQKVYPGWHRNNLVDKGGKRPMDGWITNYGFENSLKLHLQKLTEAVNDDDQKLYLEVKSVREKLAEIVKGKNATKDDRYLHRDYVKLQIEVKKSLDLTQDNLETFVAGYEKLVAWLSDIDKAAAKLLIRNGSKLAEMAQAHYGKAEEIDSGTSVGEDESGE